MSITPLSYALPTLPLVDPTAAPRSHVDVSAIRAQPAGSVVKLSGQTPSGAQASRSTERDTDIDDADLPDATKRLLKMIRDLKAAMARAQQKLANAMNDHSLSDRARAAKVKQLQAEVASLSGALSSANAELLRQVNQKMLDKDQQQTMALLLMKPV